MLSDCWGRVVRAPDYPMGWPPGVIDGAADWAEKNWGTGAHLDWWAPDAAGDSELRVGLAKFERQAASPGAAAAMRRMVFELDVRHVLPLIQAPTLVLHHGDNRFARVGHGRYLAGHIPEARYVELPGANWIPFAKDREQSFDEIEEFVTVCVLCRKPTAFWPPSCSLTSWTRLNTPPSGAITHGAKLSNVIATSFAASWNVIAAAR